MSHILVTVNTQEVPSIQKALDDNDTLFDLDSQIFAIQKAVYEVTGTPSFSRFTCEVTDEDQWTLNVEV